jgi:hypothetical protein
MTSIDGADGATHDHSSGQGGSQIKPVQKAKPHDEQDYAKRTII